MARDKGILRLLLVDDSLTEADSITGVLRRAGHAVRASRQDVLVNVEKALTSQSWDLILCRDTISAVPPGAVLNLLNRLDRDIPCIVLVTEQDKIENFYDVGAQDVVKFSDHKRLQFSVERELQNLFTRRLCRRNERALRSSEKRSRLLLGNSCDAVAYIREGMHIYVNSSYLSLFGYDDAEDIEALPILDMIAVDDHVKFQSVLQHFFEHTDTNKSQAVLVQCTRADGSGFKANIEFSHTEVEGEGCTQVIVRNNKIDTSSDQQLQLLRDHDFLTGLYSRARFIDELGKVSAKASEGKGDAELLYLVIEGFQAIKEQVGFGGSDMVLKDIANLLRKALLKGEILARYSDQVFTVIVASNNDDHAVDRAKAYQKVVESYRFNVNGATIDLLCSIGISRVTEKSSSAKKALDNADKACVEAQRLEGNRIERYQLIESEYSLSSDDDLSVWQARLQEALQHDGFKLYYQPIVSMHGEEQELYDVLLRLKGDNRQLFTADKFLKYAIQLELMDRIDEWVITHALNNLVEHRQRHPKTRFFIRLSKQTLNKSEFIEWLCALLKSHNLEGIALVFEISETTALDNLENVKTMISKLKKMGCEFALEHFGSGLDFSFSLSKLDVDYLKINGTFVENMAIDPENQAVVKAIIDMTQKAGKCSIAEFVSDANSLALLWRLGIDYAQGYYIYTPSEKLDYNFLDDNL